MSLQIDQRDWAAESPLPGVGSGGRKWQLEGFLTPDLIETCINRRTNEVDPIRLRPHPHEFELSFDV